MPLLAGVALRHITGIQFLLVRAGDAIISIAMATKHTFSTLASAFSPMKLLAALLLLATHAFAQSPQIKELDAKNGFRDVKFGSAPSLLTGAKLEAEQGAVRMYSRPADALKIGEAQVSDIFYIYLKDRLMTVRLAAIGQANSQNMLDAFIMQYGPGYRDRKYRESYSWDGQIVDMRYDQDQAGNSLLEMSSQALADEQLEDHFKQAEKGKTDL